MEAIDVLNGLLSLGFAVQPSPDGGLDVTGPQSLLDDRRRGLIREHKPALLCLLACHPEDVRRETEPCHRCGGTTMIDGASYRWCEQCGEKLGPSAWESQLERQGMRLADSPDGDGPLFDLLQWFDSLACGSELDSL